MKKIKFILFCAILFFTFLFKVDAADFSTYISGPSEINANGKFTVTIGVNGATNLYGLTGAFKYDSSKLTLVSSEAQSGFALTLGSNMVLDSSAGKSGSFAVAKITFQANSNFSVGEKASISLSGVEGGDGANLLSGSSASYSVTMAAPKSNNNYLKSLSVDVGKINFNKNTNTYKLVVENNVTKVNITASAEDDKAKVSGVGAKNLNVYANTFNIVVTAENGGKRTYTIVIERKDENGNGHKLSSVNTLKELSVEGFTIEFNPDVLEYEIKVEDFTSELKVNAVASDDTAKVEVSDTKLVVGENVITIKVTSETGVTKEYRLKVFKKDLCSECPCADVVQPKVKEKSTKPYVIAIIIEGVVILGLLGLELPKIIKRIKKMKNNK